MDSARQNEITGQVVFDISDRIVLSYHPDHKQRESKFLLVDNSEGKYVTLLPDEIKNLHLLLGLFIERME